jgi:hypothetical protein
MSKTRNRDYKREYQQFHAKPEQKQNRAQRNAARAIMKVAGQVSKGDGKDVHHVSGMSNKKSNLRVLSASKNRSIQ